MEKFLVVCGLFGLLAGSAQAADSEVDSCAQLRTQIAAKTGLLPSVDLDLLSKLSARPECRFSAAEVYRAAYGDKPLPASEHHPGRGEERHSHHDDDD